jgi:predicted ATPase
MEGFRLAEVRIKGLRCLADVRLKLGPLTVLIGENGVGKSSIIEALEILRRLSGENFWYDFNAIHSGTSLIQPGPKSLDLAVTLRNGADSLNYSIVLTPGGVGQERLIAYSGGGGPDPVFVRVGTRLDVAGGGPHNAPSPDRPAISFLGGAAPERVSIVREALRAIEVHVPFDVTPSWIAQGSQTRSPVREASMLMPTTVLERRAANLASTLFALRSNFGETHWQETLEYIRLGLGEDLETVTTPVAPNGGYVSIAIKYRGMDRLIQGSELSDGMVVWLGLVVLLRLPGTGSLLAFDEPDLHLHPALLARAVGLFESIATTRPVLVATHSDRFLDYLTQPASSVVVCELAKGRHTRLARPDPDALARWLDGYRGYGDLRSAGQEALVIRPETPAEDER